MVRRRMIKDFIRLNSGNTVAVARDVLDSNLGFVLAIFDDDGNPFDVLTAEDVQRARYDDWPLSELRPSNSSVMVTSPEVKLKNFVNSPEFIDNRAAIVFDEGELVGILTKDAIKGYQDEQADPTKGGGGSSSLLSDTMLAGGTKTPLLNTTAADKPLYYYNRHQK